MLDQGLGQKLKIAAFRRDVCFRLYNYIA